MNKEKAKKNCLLLKDFHFKKKSLRPAVLLLQFSCVIMQDNRSFFVFVSNIFYLHEERSTHNPSFCIKVADWHSCCDVVSSKKPKNLIMSKKEREQIQYPIWPNYFQRCSCKKSQKNIPVYRLKNIFVIKVNDYLPKEE